MNATHLIDNLSSDPAPTFQFTDIEGSTEKWESGPARMAQAVARHDELMRAAVEAHHGRVMKSTGDGMYAVFVAHWMPCVPSPFRLSFATRPQPPASPLWFVADSLR